MDDPDNEDVAVSAADDGKKTTESRDSRMERYRRIIEALKEKTSANKDRDII